MRHTKLEGLMTPMERLGRVSAVAYGAATRPRTAPSGTISYDNADGTRTVIGPQTGSATMATHVGDVTPPGRPLGVAGASSAGVVYVAWGGELDGGIPADFDRVSLYMSVEGVSEFVGTLTEAGIVSTVPMATTATVEVWATSEDDACLADGTPAHNVSAESDHATVAVTQGEDAAALDALRDRLSKVEATANSASSTANTAKSTADSLATMIREDATGITVGKSADGQTYSTGRTHMDEDSFDVLDKAGNVLSSFGKKIIELGKNSQDAVISMLGGLVKIKATTNAGVGGWCEISTDELVSTNGYYASRIAAGYKDETGFTPNGTAEVTVEGGEGEGHVLMYAEAGAHGSEGNSFAMSPTAYALNHPEYMLSALLGSGGGGSGVTMASDLNACGPGVFTYDTSTANRPTDRGTCVCIRAGDGTWLFQLALPTQGDPHWRSNIDGGGWTSWTTAAGVADVAWTDLWKDTSGNYVRWACRNGVVYVKWKIPQATTAQWRAGTLPAGYRPSEGTVTVAAWTEGNRMATGWVDTDGGVYFQVNSAQTNGTNQGNLSYPIW